MKTIKKHQFLLLLFVIFSIQIHAQEVKTNQNEVQSKEAKEAGGAQITFETKVIDYGTIPHNSNGVREFKFTNTGTEPLVIKNAKGSCGCTVPTWPKEPIASGESGVIKVKYATNRVGPFTKTVTLTTNANPPTTVLTIKGKVLPPEKSTESESQKKTGGAE